MWFGDWRATTDEIEGAVVGDDLCVDARTVATRCVTITAPPAEVFPWIRQMGFGRAGWYSYDWLDNLGRRSATVVHPEWQDVVAGSIVPGGPASFTAAVVDPPRAFVLQFGRPAGRMCFTLAYELRPHPAGTRLVTRMRTRIRVPGGFLVERGFLGPGDGLMVRRQLRTLAQRAGTASPSS
ncbi:MAG: hypothetical protein ACKOVH_02475 [Actinomycetota bacterium]